MRGLRQAFPFVAIAAMLVAGAFLAFARPFGLPTGAWLLANPVPAFGLTLVAGFADGINPCAIATLLLFVGALLTAAEAATRRGDARQARTTMWLVAGSYIAGIFLLYFALGAGFLEVASLRVFGNTHVFTRLAGLFAVILGLVMVVEVVFPGSGIRLAMPAPLHGVARRWGRRTSIGAAFVGGVLIGTCTIPCGGAMYLAVAALLSTIASKSYAYGLLTSYNLAFVLPLLLLVGLGGSRPVLQRLSRLHLRGRSHVKLALGVFVALVGLFALA